MKNLIRLSIVLTLGLFSCSNPKMDAELIKDMTLGYEKGVVCGVSIGDDLNSVKNNIHKEWSIKEGTESYFIKEWDDFNYLLLSLDLENNKVKNISYTIHGKGENNVLIAELENELQKELGVKFSLKEKGSWDYKDSNGESCSLTMNKFEDEDTGGTMLTVNVHKF